MAILTRLEAFEIILPLPRPLQMGAMATVERHYVIARAYDDEGNVGTAYALGRNAPVAETIDRLIAPRWLNKPLDSHPEFYANTVKGNVFLGSNGIFWRALSLADCALYDLLSRRAGQTLAEYLGGQIRPVTTTLAGFYPTADETPESLAALVELMAGMNPAAIKVTSSVDFERDTKRMELARKLIPDGPPFIIDLYCMTPNARTLLPYARKWADLHMLWLEDPFMFDDYENLAELAQGIAYPVGVGDEQTGLAHFRRLIEQGKIGVVRLDATTCGGIRAFIEIAQMAAEHHVPVSTHVYHHLHSQLSCAVPNHQWVEYMLPESAAESIQLVWNSDLKWQDGHLLPSTTGGLGIDWNEDALRHYRRA